MSSTSRAWAVAASLAAVEALKDQRFCRWNYTLRSLHHHAKNNLRSIAQDAKNKRAAATQSTQSTAVIGNRVREELYDKRERSDESMRTVMYLSTWGAN